MRDIILFGYGKNAKAVAKHLDRKSFMIVVFDEEEKNLAELDGYLNVEYLKNDIVDKDLVEVGIKDAKIAIFTAGITAQAAKKAVVDARAEGIKVGLLRPLTIWPFPDSAVGKMLKKVESVIVPELNQGQLIHEIERLAKDKADSKIIRIQRFDGELISPDDIFKAIKEAN